MPAAISSISATTDFSEETRTMRAVQIKAFDQPTEVLHLVESPGFPSLEFAILFAQLPKFARLPQPRVLLFPDVKGGVADSMLATDFADLGAGFRLAQRA